MEVDRLKRLIGTISVLNTLVTPITERDAVRKSKMSSDLTMPDWKCLQEKIPRRLPSVRDCMGDTR